MSTENNAQLNSQATAVNPIMGEARHNHTKVAKPGHNELQGAERQPILDENLKENHKQIKEHNKQVHNDVPKTTHQKHERHSGTGRDAFSGKETKGGAGNFNWGKPEDIIKMEEGQYNVGNNLPDTTRPIPKDVMGDHPITMDQYKEKVQGGENHNEWRV